MTAWLSLGAFRWYRCELPMQVLNEGAAMSGETIAVFTKNWVNPNYAAMRRGVDQAAAKLGAKTVHRVPQTPDDPVEQIAMVKALATERPDAIVFNPADVAQLAEPFRMVHTL